MEERGTREREVVRKEERKDDKLHRTLRKGVYTLKHEQLRHESDVGQGGKRRTKEITVSLFIAPAHPATHLVQIAQAEHVGVVNDDGIGVRDIQTGLNNGGSHQHIVLVVNKLKHYVLQRIAL